MDEEQQIIYHRLMKTWERTGKIGRVFCDRKEYAAKVAYSASVSMAKRNYKINNIKHNPVVPNGRGHLEPVGCVQLEFVFN